MKAHAALLALGLSLVPSMAQACAVCFGGDNDANRWAFIITTLFMTLLPLTLIGGAVYALRRRIKQLDAEEAQLTVMARGTTETADRSA